MHTWGMFVCAHIYGIVFSTSELGEETMEGKRSEDRPRKQEGVRIPQKVYKGTPSWKIEERDGDPVFRNKQETRMAENSEPEGNSYNVGIKDDTLKCSEKNS